MEGHSSRKSTSLAKFVHHLPGRMVPNRLPHFGHCISLSLRTLHLLHLHLCAYDLECLDAVRCVLRSAPNLCLQIWWHCGTPWPSWPWGAANSESWPGAMPTAGRPALLDGQSPGAAGPSADFVFASALVPVLGQDSRPWTNYTNYTNEKMIQ